MKQLFVNKEQQIRSGWKISIVLALFFVVMFVISMTYVIIQAFFGVSSVLQFILQVISEFVLIGTTYFVLKVIDKKELKDIGLTSLNCDYRELIYGLILGAVSITAIFIMLLGSGNISLATPLFKPVLSINIFTGFIFFIVVGLAEEIFSRGYCMMVLMQTGNRWIAMIVSSIIFSLLHGSNPNVTLLGLVNIFLVGLLFAYMFVKTGNIWMPIGYHITWNYFQGNIFGFPVSGTTRQGVYSIEVVKENILTGGLFGPEGGILTTIILGIGFLLVWKYAGNRQSDSY